MNVYEGLNARSEVYLSKECFCKMYPTCVSFKPCEFIYLWSIVKSITWMDGNFVYRSIYWREERFYEKWFLLSCICKSENRKGNRLAIILIVFEIRWVQLAISVRYCDICIFIEMTAEVKIPSPRKTSAVVFEHSLFAKTFPLTLGFSPFMNSE